MTEGEQIQRLREQVAQLLIKPRPAFAAMTPANEIILLKAFVVLLGGAALVG